MSELTKEYLDQKLENLATKEDLKEEIYSLEIKLKEHTNEQVKELKDFVLEEDEKLARMVSNGFEEVKGLLDVRERTKHLEFDMAKIKRALPYERVLTNSSRR